MVSGKTGPMQELFNLYSSMIRPYHSNLRVEKADGEGDQA
jgi:hypothetical protein